jgi:hypothetical protein
MKAERMMEAMLKVNEMFQGAKRSMMEGIDDQMIPQNHQACTCTDWIQEGEWMFEK